MYTRAHRAAERYLELTGREIINPDFMGTGVIVAQDDEGIAFIEVGYTKHTISYADTFEKFEHMKREDFEDLMYKFFLHNNKYIDVPVRYDIIELFVVQEDRALIRHAVNARLED